jgi:hypothetical protein
MELKDAVARAKAYVSEIFADENISEIGLEEVEFDDENSRWKITIGFYRGLVSASNEIFRSLHRTYKTVALSDTSGELISIKNRDVVS